MKKYLFAVNLSKEPCSPATLPNHNFPTLTPHHIYDGVHDGGGKHFEQDTASKLFLLRFESALCKFQMEK